MALRVLIADDEEMARKRLRRLLEAEADVSIVGEATTGEEALQLLDEIDVDLALLDVRMPFATGLDVATVATELGVEVVLCTAHAEHAVEAFAKGAVDYLLKPVEAERLAQALDRVRKRRVEPAPASDAQPLSERLALEVKGELVLVRPSSVTHAISDGDLVTLHLEDGVRHLTELSLAELARKLPQLVRVHRRALLSLEHVARLRPLPTGGYLAITRAGAEVPVARQSARQLRRALGLS
jgi:two-component system LytT family response regulator